MLTVLDSTVTYTEVSSPFEELSDIGSPGVDGLPMMPEEPYDYVEATLQAPPSPDYVPRPEEPEQAPPSPDFCYSACLNLIENQEEGRLRITDKEHTEYPMRRRRRTRMRMRMRMRRRRST
ncbi:hypothetical protein Tco_1292079 [Tanacetum coccineum]